MSIFLRALVKTALAVFLIAVLALSIPGVVKPVHAQSGSNNFTEVDAYLQETMRHLNIKGMALSIVKGDQILYMQGYGIANAQGDPATPQTPWPMGSVTKSFTALAIRQLADAGKLNLNERLQTYLPEFQLADPDKASRITLRNLIDHTSGISKLEGEAPYLNSPGTTFAENLDRLAGFQPDYPPGVHAEYCNWNYVLLGEVVSRVSGQPYVEYINEHIFAPLGMTSSSFMDYHAVPHAATGNLISYGFRVPYDEKFVQALTGASSMTSTSEDMAHYLSLFLGEGQYLGKSLLPPSGAGRYGPMWDWIEGAAPADTVYGLSGGYNSISTTCLTYPGTDLGVVLLLNTRLDQLPGVSAYDVARGVGNIILGYPYQAAPGAALYKSWAILDGSILLLLTAIVWQGLGLRGWKNRYQSSGGVKKALAWAGIVFSLLLSAVIFYLPTVLGTRWDTLLFMRPDLGIPLAAIAVLLGSMGVYKAVRSVV